MEAVVPKLTAFCLALVSVLTLAIATSTHAPAGSAPGTWSHKASMPGVRSEIATAVVDGKIYVIGGNTSEDVDGKAVERYDSGLTEVYDPETDTWQTLSPMPDGAGHVATAVLDGLIYVAGGFKARQHSQPVANFYTYDPKTDHWETLPRLPGPRGSANLAVVRGQLHLIGGRVSDEAGPLAAHDVYDPKTRTWSPAPPMPTARDHMGIAVIGDRIHVVGGRSGGADENLGMHEVFNPKSGTWSSALPMPTPRSGGAFARYRGLLFFMGGECRDGKTYNENEAYDPATRTWGTYAPLPSGRHAFAAEAVGDTLYVIGGAKGCGGGGKVADNLTFRLP